MNLGTWIRTRLQERAAVRAVREASGIFELAAETTDHILRAELLEATAEAEIELQETAAVAGEAEDILVISETSRLLSLAALAERALGEALWTKVCDLEEGACFYRRGDLRTITAIERPGDEPLVVRIAWNYPLGAVVEEFQQDELVTAGEVVSDPSALAELSGADLDEVLLWEAFTFTPRRTSRAIIYRELATLPCYAGIERAKNLLEALAEQEYHLDPSTPRHPDLQARDQVENRKRFSDWATLATLVCMIIFYAADGAVLRVWLIALAGLTLVVALRLGAHERLKRG